MRKRMNHGLTLVEMLAALAITALILAAVLPVTASLARSHALGENTQEQVSLESALRGLLATDLVHARSYRMTPNGVELEGLATLDLGTLELQHIPSTVRYEVRRIGARSWLARVQGSDPAGWVAELVCSDASAIGLRDASQPAAASGDWQELPDAVIVRVGFATADRAPVEFLLHRR